MHNLGIIAPFKSWGGIERKMVILCREFLRHDVRPEIVLLRGGVEPYPDLLPPEVEIIDLTTRSKLDGSLKLARYFRDRRPRAVITAKDHSAQTAIFARGLARTRTPIFVKVTNTLSMVVRRGGKRHMIKWLYPRMDGIIAISQGVADDLVQAFGIPQDKVSVIYNPMITPDFPERLAAPADHPWLQPGQPPVILGAGRLTRQKDFSSLIEAFAMVRRSRACRLLILGEGPEREALQHRIRDLAVDADAQLPGFVADPLPFMHRAKAFALSSIYEGLGNVLIEAMAAGIRIVATDCPSGPAEILEGGRYGELVEPANPAAMAAALARQLDAPGRAEPPDAALDRFDSARVARSYLRLFGMAGQLGGTEP